MNDKIIVRLMRVPIPPLHAVYCILIITHNFTVSILKFKFFVKFLLFLSYFLVEKTN